MGKLERDKIVKILFFGYWFVLFLATTIPSKSLPGTMTSDKTNHYAAYFILTILSYNFFIVQNKIKIAKKFPLLNAAIFGLIYGILDELHQIPIPGRFYEPLDILANSLGVTTAILIIFLYTLIKNRNKKDTEE